MTTDRNGSDPGLGIFGHELPFEAGRPVPFSPLCQAREVDALEKGLKKLTWNLSPNRSTEKLARSPHP